MSAILSFASAIAASSSGQPKIPTTKICSSGLALSARIWSATRSTLRRGEQLVGFDVSVPLLPSSVLGQASVLAWQLAKGAAKAALVG